MPTLVLSDIHSNWHALRAIPGHYDQCLFLGDLVDYGLDPEPCVQWVREHATHAIRGNHDHGVAQGVTVLGDSGYRYLTRVTRPHQWRSLSAESRRYLLQLPLTRRLMLNDRRVLMVHATPRDPLDEYLLNDPETWARRVANVQADLVLVGHSHMQFTLTVDGVTILNPGSVGQPRDSDPRAAYAVIDDDGTIHLRRVPYDTEAAAQALEHIPLPDRARNCLCHVLRHARLPADEPCGPED